MAAPSPRPEYIFRGHTATVNNIAFIHQDEYFVSCDMDGWIFIWKMKIRRVILQWKAHESSCMAVNIIDDETLISQGRDNMIHIWKLSSSLLSKPDLLYSIPYSAVNFCKLSCHTNEQNTAFVCYPSLQNTSLFNIFDLNNRKLLIRDTGADTSLQLGACMAVELFETNDHLCVLAGYENAYTVLWEIKETKSTMIWSKKEHSEPILSLSMDSIKSVAISSAADNQLCKYNMATGDVIKKITVKKSGLDSLKIRNDSKLFATAGYDGRIRVFSYKTMKPLAVLSYHRDSVTSIDFGKENKSWLIAASDINISLWNIY